MTACSALLPRVYGVGLAAKDAYAMISDKPLPAEFEKAYRIACKSGVSFHR